MYPDLDEAAEWIDTHSGLVRLAELEGVGLSAPGHGSLMHADTGSKHLMAYIGKGGDAQDTLEGQPYPACVKQYGEHLRTENDTKIYRARKLKSGEQVRLQSAWPGGRSTAEAGDHGRSADGLGPG